MGTVWDVVMLLIMLCWGLGVRCPLYWCVWMLGPTWWCCFGRLWDIWEVQSGGRKALRFRTWSLLCLHLCFLVHQGAGCKAEALCCSRDCWYWRCWKCGVDWRRLQVLSGAGPREVTRHRQQGWRDVAWRWLLNPSRAQTMLCRAPDARHRDVVALVSFHLIFTSRVAILFLEDRNGLLCTFVHWKYIT